MVTYGYARVNTTGQTLATQRSLRKAAGVERIFSEKVSRVADRRPELEYVLDALEAGDVLMVKSWTGCRAAPSTCCGSSTRLAERALGRSLGQAGQRLVLTVLAGIAEFERDLILREPMKAAPVR